MKPKVKAKGTAMAYDEFILTDSLEKILPDQRPKRRLAGPISGLVGETVSLQLGYYMEYGGGALSGREITVSFESEIADHIRMRKTELVPATLPAYREHIDDNYLFTEPCLCPDLLVPAAGGVLRPYANQWRSAWIDIEVTGVMGPVPGKAANDAPNDAADDAANDAADNAANDAANEMRGRDFPVLVAVKRGGETVWSESFTLHAVNAALPAQKLIYTEWFHADCLADYYRVEPFSERHWEIVEQFVHTAAEHGVNMLLTPVFTPPLDTEIGGERTTVQLVGVRKEGEKYAFDFSRLRRWISMCRRNSIKYLEISHLFTQWGAKCAPKIMAEADGEYKQIFGWDTAAAGEDYVRFLKAFLPELKRVLKEEGFFDSTYFHISDEPHGEQMASYNAAKQCVKELLADCHIIDALSSFEFYRTGVVEQPIVSSNCIKPFIDAEVKHLWTYYCCAQGNEVSNQFMSMPSARNRILGVQLYLYRIEGFLHWGYNFYNSQNSVSAINPYIVTDGGGAFPSGDPFLVYPAKNGAAYDSLRFMVLSEALYDLRAFEKLEELSGRGCVVSLIEEGMDYKITFNRYPKEAEYLLQLREKVNRRIEELTSAKFL